MTTAVRFERGGDRYALRFTYDPTIVAMVKTLPPYAGSWIPTAKVWLVIDAYAEQLAEMMTYGDADRFIRQARTILDRVLHKPDYLHNWRAFELLGIAQAATTEGSVGYLAWVTRAPRGKPSWLCRKGARASSAGRRASQRRGEGLAPWPQWNPGAFT